MRKRSKEEKRRIVEESLAPGKTMAGADTGGERAAAIYTLIGSAKLNGIDPAAYLRFVLERIADHPVRRIEELLPWNVTLEQEQARPAA